MKLGLGKEAWSSRSKGSVQRHGLNRLRIPTAFGCIAQV